MFRLEVHSLISTWVHSLADPSTSDLYLGFTAQSSKRTALSDLATTNCGTGSNCRRSLDVQQMQSEIEVYGVRWMSVLFVLCAISTFFVFLRVYARTKRSEFRRSDAVMLFTWISTIIYLASSVRNWHFLETIAQRKADHIESSPSFEDSGMINIVLFQIAQCVAIPMSKLSVALLLLEIDFERKRLIILRCLVVFLVLQAITTSFISLFNCAHTPSGLDWSVLAHPRLGSSNAPEGKCIEKIVLLSTRTMCSAAAETTLFVLAVILICNIRVSSRQKIGLLFTFGFGFATCAASALSAYYEGTAYKMIGIDFANSTKQFFTSHIFATGEIYVGLSLAAALPIRAQLLRFVLRLCRLCGLPVTESQTQSTEHSESSATMEDLSVSPRSEGLNLKHMLKVTTTCIPLSDSSDLEKGWYQDDSTFSTPMQEIEEINLGTAAARKL